MRKHVCVIDIGSNSIKALVASNGETPESIEVVMEASLEVRISKGIGQSEPVLSEDGIQRGATAVKELLDACSSAGPLSEVQIVATSAVRSARNSDDFQSAVKNKTGHAVGILSGEEEANGIAAGILTDASLANLDSFTAFDLGGGSLELMAFRNRELSEHHSFELGSVRLMERFIPLPEQRVPISQQEALCRYLETTLLAGPVPFRSPLVGCGGGLTVATRISASQKLALNQNGFFPKEWFDQLKPLVVDASHVERLRIPGIPESRADIFPVALLTCSTLINLCASDGIHHSTHNLRYGLAQRALAALGE